ncbi:beta-1,3-galactosyltransferase 5-like [Argopecten irradians]|uniref:beta-1,3-galactosyltransferase 5-like n=1 Tax=Argopecten irradians TaxID=31199 RepID=UPI00371D1729
MSLLKLGNRRLLRRIKILCCGVFIYFLCYIIRQLYFTEINKVSTTNKETVKNSTLSVLRTIVYSTNEEQKSYFTKTEIDENQRNHNLTEISEGRLNYAQNDVSNNRLNYTHTESIEDQLNYTLIQYHKVRLTSNQTEIKENQPNNVFTENIKNNPVISIRPFENFSYPLDVDMVELVETYKKQGFVKEKVINPFPYQSITNPMTKCKVTKRRGREDSIFILFLVKSSYHHIAQRDAIRRTWGDEKYMLYFNIRTIFILGLPPGGTDPRVNKEWLEHRDILQMNFVDTYMNNTLKMMASVYWTTEHCSNAHFITMVDDDFYVGLETLITLLEKLPPHLQQSLYLGNIFTFRNPSRDRGFKWYISPKEYAFDLFPPFINAGTIVMSMDFVKDVSIAMPYTALFRFDDVYMSIVAYKLGIAPLGSKRFCNCKILPGIKDYLFNYIVTSHGYTPRELIMAWDRHMKRSDITPALNI